MTFYSHNDFLVSYSRPLDERMLQASAREREGGPGLGPKAAAMLSPEVEKSNQPKLAVLLVYQCWAMAMSLCPGER